MKLPRWGQNPTPNMPQTSAALQGDTRLISPVRQRRVLPSNVQLVLETGFKEAEAKRQIISDVVAFKDYVVDIHDEKQSSLGLAEYQRVMTRLTNRIENEPFVTNQVDNAGVEILDQFGNTIPVFTADDSIERYDTARQAWLDGKGKNMGGSILLTSKARAKFNNDIRGVDTVLRNRLYKDQTKKSLDHSLAMTMQELALAKTHEDIVRITEKARTTTLIGSQKAFELRREFGQALNMRNNLQEIEVAEQKIIANEIGAEAAVAGLRFQITESLIRDRDMDARGYKAVSNSQLITILGQLDTLSGKAARLEREAKARFGGEFLIRFAGMSDAERAVHLTQAENGFYTELFGPDTVKIMRVYADKAKETGVSDVNARGRVTAIHADYAAGRTGPNGEVVSIDLVESVLAAEAKDLSAPYLEIQIAKIATYRTDERRQTVGNISDVITQTISGWKMADILELGIGRIPEGAEGEAIRESRRIATRFETFSQLPENKNLTSSELRFRGINMIAENYERPYYAVDSNDTALSESESGLDAMRNFNYYQSVSLFNETLRIAKAERDAFVDPSGVVGAGRTPFYSPTMQRLPFKMRSRDTWDEVRDEYIKYLQNYEKIADETLSLLGER